LTLGTLEVHAYCEGREVAAELEIVNVGKYHTPITLKLPPGTYILIAEYYYQEIKAAEVQQDKTTLVDFYFEKPSLTLAYFHIATSLASLAIAIIGLWFTITKKKS